MEMKCPNVAHTNTERMIRSPWITISFRVFFSCSHSRKTKYASSMSIEKTDGSTFPLPNRPLTLLQMILKDIGLTSSIISSSHKGHSLNVDCGISGDVCTSHFNSIVVVFASEIYQSVCNMSNLFRGFNWSERERTWNEKQTNIRKMSFKWD